MPSIPAFSYSMPGCRCQTIVTNAGAYSELTRLLKSEMFIPGSFSLNVGFNYLNSALDDDDSASSVYQSNEKLCVTYYDATI